MGSEEEPYDPLDKFDVDESFDMDHRAFAYLAAVTGHEATFAVLCAALRRNDPLVTSEPRITSNKAMVRFLV
jgi:hypothetical protein